MIIGTPNSIYNLDKDLGSTPYLIVGDGDCRISRELVKSLGLIVDDTLIWSNHIDYISGKVKRGVGLIKKTSKYLDKNYRTFVETHFMYSTFTKLWQS